MLRAVMGQGSNSRAAGPSTNPCRQVNEVNTDSSNNQRVDNHPVETAPTGQPDEAPKQAARPPVRVGKWPLILAGVFLTLPALIPLSYVPQAETGGMLAFLIGFAIAILVINATLLYVLYRWLMLVARG